MFKKNSPVHLLVTIIAAGLIIQSCFNREKNIIATVDDVQITIDDFLGEMGIYRLKTGSLNIAPNDPKYLEIKKEILNSMIREKILLSETAALKITASEAEVEAAVKRIRSDYPGDTFTKQLRDFGINYALWKSKIKNSILMEKLTAKITAKTPDISDEEIAQYYEKNKDEFTEPEQVRAFQIVVKTEEEAYKIYRELNMGKKFEDLAREQSITPEAADGGDIGYFTRDSVPAVFENILFTIKQGKISKVVASEYGYHILKVAEKKPAQLKKLEEVRDTILQNLIDLKKDEIFSNWFKEKITNVKVKRNNTLLANIK